MPLKNLASSVQTFAAIAAQVASASVNGASLNLSASTTKPGEDLSFLYHCNSLGGGTVTFKIQTAPDNAGSAGSWTDLSGTSWAATAAGIFAVSLRRQELLKIGTGPWVRVVATLAGATNASLAAIGLGYNLRVNPPVGAVNGTDYIAL